MIRRPLLRSMQLAAALGASLCLTAPAMAETQWPEAMVVSTPASGTSVHMVAVGMGRAVEKFTPVKRWIAQPVGGPSVWAPMMRDGSTHLAIHSGPDTINVLFGRGAYEKQGAMPFIRTLIPGHEYAFMFHTIPETGIKTLADLKGKKVYTKLPGNPMFQSMLDAQLAAAGLKEADLKASMTMPNVREATRDLIEGRVDAFLYPIVPSSVKEINQAKGETIFLNLTEGQANAVAKQLPGYFPGVIPADAPEFANKRELKWAMVFRTCLYGRSDADEEMVYQLVKNLLDHHDAWKDAHPQAASWGPMYADAPPYHAGAIRYYKEKGLWTAEAQAHQDKMLAALKADR